MLYSNILWNVSSTVEWGREMFWETFVIMYSDV